MTPICIDRIDAFITGLALEAAIGGAVSSAAAVCSDIPQTARRGRIGKAAPVAVGGCRVDDLADLTGSRNAMASQIIMTTITVCIIPVTPKDGVTGFKVIGSAILEISAFFSIGKGDTPTGFRLDYTFAAGNRTNTILGHGWGY